MITHDRQETPFHYWISFWPVAPLFGVAWRFEKLMPTAPFFSPTRVAADMAAAGAAEAARAATEAVDTLSHQVDAAVQAASDAVATAAGAMSAAGEAFASRVEEATHVAAGAVVSGADLFAAPAAAAADTVASPGQVAPPGPGASPECAAPQKPALLYDRRPANADDLQRIRGVGPKLEAMLNAMGVYTLEQIAGFSEGNLAWIDAKLTAFRGRPLRDDWVAQAKALL
jgi:predicted flap endonuclease-1-like 5' DNA nuclease